MTKRREQPFEEIAKLLGHNVKLIFAWDDPQATITGYFFGLDVEGNATVDTVERRHYVWPVLYAEHLETCCKHVNKGVVD